MDACNPEGFLDLRNMAEAEILESMATPRIDRRGQLIVLPEALVGRPLPIDDAQPE